MLRLFVLLWVLFPAVAFAQEKFSGTLKGKVLDSAIQTSLHGANIVLLDNADSTTISYGTADSSGLFELKNLPAGIFIFEVSFTGFIPYVMQISLTAGSPIFDVGTVCLIPNTNTLEGVIVTRPPVTIKGDTVEFRASAFKTPPNATAEDLLKRLPGMEVDREGNILAQGEEITRVFVDGKEFFSNDPKLATKNLSADMIESIQVFDDMSDEAKFTNMDDGSRIRTINIKLRKDKKRGTFGRAVAGIGSSDRYTASANANMFNDNTQLSILGGANNVNRLGFTQNDVQQSLAVGNTRGGSNNRANIPANRNTAGAGNNGDGNTDSWSTGINFRHTWGNKANISANYFVSNTDRDIRRNSFRQNFFPNDSVSFSNTDTRNLNTNQSHNITIRFEYNIDSFNTILVTPNVRWGKNQTLSFDSVLTTASGKFGEYLAIAGSNSRLVQGRNRGFGNNLLFRHKFKRPGSSFTIGWNTSINVNDGDGLNETPYLFFRPDSSIRRIQDIKQRYYLEGNSFNNTLSASLTRSIGPGKMVELNYAYSYNQSTNNRETFDYDPATGRFDSLNKPLTNFFENGFTSSRIGGNYRVKKKKFDYQMGGAVQFADLDNMSRQALTGKDSTLQHRYVNFFPNASFNYNFGTRKNMRFQYKGNTRAPNINQLQNVLDISNPIRWRVGNPDLGQEFTHSLIYTLNTFNANNFIYFNTNLQANLIYNRIVNGIDTVSSAVQIIKPENVDGAHNFSLSSTLGIPLKKVASGRRSPMNLNLTTNLRYNRDVSLLFKQINFNYNYSAGQRIAFNYNIDQKLDLNAHINLTYFDSRYTVQQNLNNKYLNHRYGVDATAWVFKKLSIQNDFELMINGGRADGFNKAIPLWNSSAAWLIFKKSNGEIKFSVIDMLNQNKSITRNVGDNFINDAFTNVLQRFFMITFMVNINRFGGKPGTAMQQPGAQPGKTSPYNGGGQGGRPLKTTGN
jgi:hypothetical protein